MTFLVPGLAIAGVLATAIPIIIHFLFRRRRKPIEWAAMRQLMEAIRRTSRRLRLEQLLLLAVRCALVLALGLALGQPVLRAAGLLGVGQPRTLFVVVDDSIASAARTGDGESGLDRSIASAKALIETLQPADAIGVIATARPARGLVVPPSTDHGSIIRVLESLQPAQTPNDLPAALGELRVAIDRLDAGQQVAAILLSDWRQGSTALDTPLPPVLTASRGAPVRLFATPPAEEPITNVQVASIDPLRSLILPAQSDGSGQVTVRLARHGDRLPAGTTRVRLQGEGIAPVAPRTVNWDAGQATASVVFTISPLNRERSSVGLVATIDEDGQPRDDARFTVVEARDRVRVALLDRRTFGAEAALDRLSPGQWMSRALRPSEDSPIEVTTLDPSTFDERDLRGVDAVLAPRPDLLTTPGWEALRRFVDRGGVVLVTPPAELNVHLWVDALVSALDLPWSVGLEPVTSAEGETLAERQPASEFLHLLSGELPQLVRPVEVYRRLPIERDGNLGSSLLVLADESPLALAGTPRHEQGPGSAGLVVLLATAPDLEWTNLPAKPLMVPLLQELVRQGVSLAVASQQTLAGDRPVLPAGTAAIELGDGDTSIVLDIDATSRPARPVEQSGLYRLVDPAGLVMGTLAVNVDTEAARTEPQPGDAVRSWLEGSGPWTWLDTTDIAAALRPVEGGAGVSGWLLGAALALALIESILARRFSHASRGLASPGAEAAFGSGSDGVTVGSAPAGGAS